LKLELFQLHGIGDPRELSLQSRTKDNAVHVGHSLPLVLSKEPSKFLLVNLALSLSNNLLTALAHMEMKDAMEDSWTKHSNT